MRCYKCYKFVLDIISISRCHHNNNGNNKHNSLSFQLDCILKECLEASLKCSQRDQKGQFHQHANAQLLRAQVLKAQKAAWLGAQSMLMKLTPKGTKKEKFRNEIANPQFCKVKSIDCGWNRCMQFRLSFYMRKISSY